MRKLIKQMSSLLFVLGCMCMLLPVQVSAAGKIDTDKKGSLTITYTHESAPVAGVQFDLYKVADVDAYAEYTLAGDFKTYPVELKVQDSSEWKTLAETLSAYADRDQVAAAASGKTDEKGQLVFADQKPGLYLAVGRTLTDDTYTYTTEPFLVALPGEDSAANDWNYDVTVEAKHTREENPKEETVEAKVLKVWKKDTKESRPEKVVVELLKDGEVYDKVTLNAAGDWKHTWTKLPRYNDKGKQITWKVTEQAVDDYKVKITKEGSTFVVTNTYSPEEPSDGTLTRKVQKVWSDSGYTDKRPDSIKVSLLKDGQVYDTQTLSDDNSWSYTWDGLAKTDSDGSEISWSLSEASVSGYTASVTQSEDTFVLTNTYNASKLPQTGLLWWPVPVLAAAGLLLLIIGLLIKRTNHSQK